MTDHSDPHSVPVLQALESMRKPAWLWDYRQGRIIWANSLGLTFWKEHDLAHLKKRFFDRSMPALSTMLRYADLELPEEGLAEDLLFWTDSGPKYIECNITHHLLPDGTSGILLIGADLNNSDNHEAEAPIKWVEPTITPDVDTTYKNSLSSPEDQETLKEIARLLSEPEEDEANQEKPDNDPAIPDTNQDLPAVFGIETTSTSSPFEQFDLEADRERVNGHINGSLNGHDTPINSEITSEEKNTFLAKVNHEVRTPLSSIIGFAELMKEEKFGELGHQKYKGYVEDILESAHHALSLINDLLDISRVETGNFQLSPAPIDLNSTIEHCVSSLQPQTGQARLVIRQSLARDLPKISADHRSLRQIILNLLSNAIKFTTAGGQIIISTQKESTQKVRLRVRDTGMGMSESDLQIALQPFGQIETSMNGSSGTGLGLPLTKALVEANEAEFHISSQEGRGTLVEILFSVQQIN